VKAPVVTTLATAEPDTVPIKPLATAAALAGPPTRWPVSDTARSMKNRPAPERIRSEPKMMNKTMYVEQTCSGIPKIPSLLMNRVSMNFPGRTGGP